MLAPQQLRLNEEEVPIPEGLFGRLSLASPPDAVEIAKSLPEPERARLAAFCYYRRHRHALGLMIAASCSRGALVKAAGHAGRAIFDQSRDPQKTMLEESRSSGTATPKPVSLAGKASS